MHGWRNTAFLGGRRNMQIQNIIITESQTNIHEFYLGTVGLFQALLKVGF